MPAVSIHWTTLLNKRVEVICNTTRTVGTLIRVDNPNQGNPADLLASWWFGSKFRMLTIQHEPTESDRKFSEVRFREHDPAHSIVLFAPP